MDKETSQALVNKLLESLESCTAFLEETAMELNVDFREAVKASEDDLPLLLSENEWAGKKIKGEDLLNPHTLIEVLSNEVMEDDTYYTVGINDGKLYLLMGLFDTLKMDEEKNKALTYIYRD